MRERLEEFDFLMIFKSGIGSVLAILIAERLNLLYSASAGIITLLTLQNTRKETFYIALKRILAFLIALLTAYIIFTNIGYTVPAFGFFIFIFSGISNLFGLESGITMNSVIVTHFLTEGRMDASLILNEGLLMVIGMGIGVLINLIMFKNVERIKEDQKIVEEGIKRVLECMANMLEGEKICNYVRAKNYAMNFTELENLIEELLSKAYEDVDNSLVDRTKYRISYLQMRKRQMSILKDIRENIEEIHDVLPEGVKISEYINKISLEVTERNDVGNLLGELDELVQYFREEELPVTREEFENRAILFVILKDLRFFLNVKNSFIQKYYKKKKKSPKSK